MSQKINKIRIHHAHTQGGGNDGSDLLNCYFLPTTDPTQYVFFDSTDTPILTTPMPVTNLGRFTFNLPGDKFTWYIPDPAAGSEQFQVIGRGPTAKASGSWANDDGGPPPASVRKDGRPGAGGDPTGESGTFQAAAGLTMDPEAEDAASAAKA